MVECSKVSKHEKLSIREGEKKATHTSKGKESIEARVCHDKSNGCFISLLCVCILHPYPIYPIHSDALTAAAVVHASMHVFSGLTDGSQYVTISPSTPTPHARRRNSSRP